MLTENVLPGTAEADWPAASLRLTFLITIRVRQGKAAVLRAEEKHQIRLPARQRGDDTVASGVHPSAAHPPRNVSIKRCARLWSGRKRAERGGSGQERV